MGTNIWIEEKADGSKCSTCEKPIESTMFRKWIYIGRGNKQKTDEIRCNACKQ